MVASFRSPSLFLSFLTPHLLLAFHSSPLPPFFLFPFVSPRVPCCARRGYSLPSLSPTLFLYRLARLHREIRLYTYFVFSSLSKTSFPCTCLFYPQSHSPVAHSPSLFFVFFLAVAFFFFFFFFFFFLLSSPHSTSDFFSWLFLFLLAQQLSFISARTS